MKQIPCPNCFAEDAKPVYVCSDPACAHAQSPVPAEEAAKGEGGELCCPACQRKLQVRVCPRCGYELLEKDGAAETMPISIVGVHGAGKSNYLAVLIEQIRTRMSAVYGCSLYPLGGDATMNHYDLSYHRPLYELGRCIPSTEQADVQPLRYCLVFPQEKGAPKTLNLAFYDACGANFESEKSMKEFGRSIYHSKGILFFVDPTQMPVMRDNYRAEERPVVDGDPGDLLVRTLHLIRTGQGITNVEKKINIPFAVCVTKMDTVLPSLDPSSFLRMPSRHLDSARLDKADLSCCNLEMQSLLQSWGCTELVQHVKVQIAKNCFFGVSALGAEPNPQNHIPRISPHRVLDPLLWLLYKNGVLHAG